MIRGIAMAAAIALAGCASTETDISPDYSYAKDVRIGLEAESIGNWPLARTFLEKALEQDTQHRIASLFDDERVLSDDTRQDAMRALSRIYYEQKDLDALYSHLHRYWRVEDLSSVPWVSEAEEQRNLRYHMTWYCQLLDDHNRFSEAQACWAKIGENKKAEASIRAFELKEVFRR